MSEKKEFIKVLAKIESDIVLTNDGLYERQQWPTVVEWWGFYGDSYSNAKKVDEGMAEHLEKMFKEG